MIKKYGFTLAEVLITLGIIGVVVSMTIPVLIQEHKKSVVVNKLKKASSTLGQAYNMSKVDYGDFSREGFPYNDPDSALEMFNKYYVPYIKFLKVEKGSKGVFAYLPDGTVWYFRRHWWDGNQNWANTYIIVCIDSKACKNISENYSSVDKDVNGKDTFTLYIDGRAPDYTLLESGKTHEEIIEQCKKRTNIEACTSLIFEAGWQIPKDYPIRL